MGGQTSREGRIEIQHNGQWGTICDDHWDDNAATVACRQLNFAGYVSLVVAAAAAAVVVVVVVVVVMVMVVEVVMKKIQHSGRRGTICDDH